jgi:hypothetical protein
MQFGCLTGLVPSTATDQFVFYNLHKIQYNLYKLSLSIGRERFDGRKVSPGRVGGWGKDAGKNVAWARVLARQTAGGRAGRRSVKVVPLLDLLPTSIVPE